MEIIRELYARFGRMGLVPAHATAGFPLAACFEAAGPAARHPRCARPLDTLNPTASLWRELVTDEGFPFLKKGVLRPENRTAFDAAAIDAFVARHFSGSTEKP